MCMCVQVCTCMHEWVCVRASYLCPLGGAVTSSGDQRTHRPRFHSWTPFSTKKNQGSQKKWQVVLAGWLRWLVHHPIHQKAAGSIWSGHIPRLWVPSLVRVHAGGNRSLFLSDISLSPPPFLPSKISKNISSDEDFINPDLCIYNIYIYIMSRKLQDELWVWNI